MPLRRVEGLAVIDPNQIYISVHGLEFVPEHAMLSIGPGDDKDSRTSAVWISPRISRKLLRDGSAAG